MSEPRSAHPGPSRPSDPSLDEAHARSLFDSALPELQPIQLRRLGRGWDHDVFLVNDRWAFRFPRNAAAAQSLELEFELLPWLAPRLPLRVPAPVWRGIFDASKGWSFAGHLCIPGETVCDAGLDATARARLAPALGRFVRALHALTIADVPVRLPPEPLGRMNTAKRGPQTRDRLLSWKVEGLLPPAVVARLVSLLEDCPARAPDDGDAIIHTDLHSRNLLVDSDGSLTGVIDWVDVHAGERALDLASAFVVLPRSARDSFLQEYGSVTAGTLVRARWRAIDHTTRALAGSIERGDSAFAKACREALIEMSAS